MTSSCHFAPRGIFPVTVCLAFATAGAQTTHTVELVGIEFIPQNLSVNVGDTVRWDWISGFHNVESGVVVNGIGIHDGIFRSGEPTNDENTIFQLTFNQTFLEANPLNGNVYQYFCIVHAGVNMIGTVTVQLGGDCTSNADCDDNDACNGAEICSNGHCVDGTALICNDQNPCTDDSCDAITGCLNIADNANTCSDGDACTDDACNAGDCVSTAIAGCLPCTSAADCDDGNTCTTDACNAGSCESTNHTNACDDGDPCTGGDSCLDGVCSGLPIGNCCAVDSDCGTAAECTTFTCVGNACVSTPVSGCLPCTSSADCDDGNPCTDDVCDTGMCIFTENAAACDDDDACTENDICAGSACSGTPINGCDENPSDPVEPTGGLCGATGMVMLLGMFLGLGALRFTRRG